MSTVTSPDGTTIDYDRHGSGPTVIFVGGATQYRALSEHITHAATLLADEGFTTVAYDRRGRGRSTDTAPWSLAREAEDVAALIGAVGGPATLCTMSSGATVALAAVLAGADVGALALYEPPVMPGVDLTDGVATLRRLVAEGKHDEAMRYNLTTLIGLPAEAVAGMAQAPSWPLMIATAPTLVYDIAAVNDVNLDPDWTKRWADVTVPTIVCSGDQTSPFLTSAADATAAALPKASRRVLPGQTHSPAPDVLVPVLVEFLRAA